MKTLIFDIDGVLLINGIPTAMGLLAARLRETFNVIIVTSRPPSELTQVELDRLGLGECERHELPPEQEPNKWKVECIERICKGEDVAAVFEDNPGVLMALSSLGIRIVPIYSGYFK